MSIISLNKIQKILHFFVLIFPIIIVLRSAAINTTLAIISAISILYILIKKNYFFFEDNFVKFIIIFFGFIFINSIVQFNDLETSLKSLANYRYLLLTFAVFISLENIPKKNFNLFIYLNLLLITLIGLDILYQFNIGKNIFGFLPGMCDINQNNCVRFSGVFGTELIAGAYLSHIGLLFFFLVKDDKKFEEKNFFKVIIYTYLFILFFFILLTGERNAPLVFLICILLFFFLQKKIKIVNFFILNFIFFLILLLVVQNSHFLKSRYINFFDVIPKGQVSLIDKVKNNPWSYHYQAAYELFLEKPLIGHGYKSFRFKCKHTNIEKKTIENPDEYRNFRACSSHPHNYAMEFLSENGIIGFLFFLTFFLIIFNKILNLKKYLKNKKSNIVLGIGSLLLAVMFPLKPSGAFFTTFNASILFYMLGFFLFYIDKLKKDES